MDYADDCFAIFLNYQSENKRLDRYLGLRVTCLVVITIKPILGKNYITTNIENCKVCHWL